MITSDNEWYNQWKRIAANESNYYRLIVVSETATGGVLKKNVVLEVSQNSQENTCARKSFLIKLPKVCNFIKKSL